MADLAAGRTTPLEGSPGDGSGSFPGPGYGAQSPPASGPATATASPGRRPKRLGLVFWVASAYLLLLLFAAIFAPVLPFKDPLQPFPGVSKDGPSLQHWFGADGLGRDMFSRVIYGAQVSLIVASVSAGLALVIGGLVGLSAGYHRGRVERLITAVTDATLVVPPLLLALTLILFLDPDGQRRIAILIAVFVLLSIAPIARVVRASTLVWADREFVLAAKTMGARDGRILLREVLPNVAPTLVSYSLIVMASLIVVEGAVAFLGLSVPPPTPSWGEMINDGRRDLNGAAHITMAPATVMFLTVLALNYVGDKLQARFEPRESVL